MSGPGDGKVELLPAGKDTFAGRFTIEFSRDSGGAVEGFTVAAGRVRGIGYRRLSPTD